MCVYITKIDNIMAIDGTYYMRNRYVYIVHIFHTANRQLLRTCEVFRGWELFHRAHGHVFHNKEKLYDHMRRHCVLPLKPMRSKLSPQACYHVQRVKAYVPVYIKRSKTKPKKTFKSSLDAANPLEQWQYQRAHLEQPIVA